MSCSNRTGIFAAAVSTLAAVLSSACCWGPLLALGLGTSLAGFSTTFAPLRPYLLGLAALSLGVSFYLLFIRPRRSDACDPDSACAAPRPRLRGFQVGMFWLSTVMVSAFAFFPDYVGIFLPDSSSTPSAPADLPAVTYQVDGMTCKACATTLAQTLEQLPGVASADVDFDKSSARIQTSRPLDAALDKAIKDVFAENDFSGKLNE